MAPENRPSQKEASYVSFREGILFPFGSTSIPCSIWSTAMKVLVHCCQISSFVKGCFDQAEYFTYLKYDVLLVGISHTNNNLKCCRTKSHYNKAHLQLSYPFPRLLWNEFALKKHDAQYLSDEWFRRKKNVLTSHMQHSLKFMVL